jgi:hypothetical protein
MMCSAIDNPARCEILALIGFLHSKNISAVESHPELCAIYGQNIMSEETVRQRCRMFKDGHKKNVHDKDRNGRPSALYHNISYVLYLSILLHFYNTIHMKSLRSVCSVCSVV